MAPATLTPELLLAHDSFLRGLARSLLFDGAAADDVVQQAYLKALESPPAQPEAARAWLATTVRRLASNFRRGERNVKTREAHAAQAEGVPSAADIVAREALRQKVVQVVLDLDEPYRTMVFLRYFEGLTPQQIAARLGLPGGTVRVRLMRALEQLRGRLDALHEGDRRAWALVLVPLARPAAGGAAGVGAAASLAALWPWLLGTMAALLAVAAWQWWPPAAAPASAAAAPAVATPLVEPRSRPASQPAASLPAAAARGREAVATPPVHGATDPRWLAGFRGRLLRTDQTPAAGAAVRIVSVDPVRALTEDLDPLADTQPGLRFEAPDTRTAADGTFELRGVWPHAYYLLLADAGPDQGLARPLERSPASGEVLDLGDLRLGSRAQVAGRVVDEDGQPVADAVVLGLDLPSVVAEPLPADLADAPLCVAWQVEGRLQVGPVPAAVRRLLCHILGCRARTGPDGRFVLRGAPVGAWTLSVFGAGHLPLARPGPATRAGVTQEVGDVRLATGETLEGTLLDAEGRPVADAEVMAGAPSTLVPLHVLRQRARTDPAGRFRLAGLPAGRLVAAARARADGAWEAFGPARAEDLEELVLTGLADLTVRLTTADGQPVVGATVRAVPSRRLGQMFALGCVPPAPTAPQATADGRYRFAGLTQGDWTVLARADGLALASLELRLMTSKESVLTLPRAVPLTVVVVDPAGAPVADAQVFVESDPAPAWATARLPLRSFGMASFWDTLPQVTARTDPQGRARLDGIPPGKAIVSVHHPAFATVAQALELPQSSLVVTLPAGGVVEGRITDNGRPAPGQLVVLDCWFGTRPGNLPQREVCAVTDAEGHFAIRGVTPASYLVGIKAGLGAVHSLGQLVAWFQSGEGMSLGTVRRQVAVRAGETVRLDLDLNPQRAAAGERAITVRGRVLVDGLPLAGGVVAVRNDLDADGVTGLLLGADQDARATLDHGGGFELERIRETASMTVVVARTGLDTPLWRGRLTPKDGALDVRLDLRTARATGRALTAAGAPAGGATLEWSGAVAGGSCRHVVACDAEGGFAAVDLLPGTYTLVAEWRDAERAFRRKRTGIVVGSEGLSSLDLRLQPTCQLGGTLAEAARAAGPTSYVTARREGDEIQLHMQVVQGDGSFLFTNLDAGTYTLSFRIGGSEWQVPGTIQLDQDLVGKQYLPIAK